MSKPSRRDFLKVVTSYLLGVSGLLGLAGIGRFLSYDGSPPRRSEFDLGEAGAFPVGSRTRVGAIPALILRLESGFTALSLECTHLGCTVKDAAAGFACPCHGSQYDQQGEVMRGPAHIPLRHLRAEVDAQGHLIVHTD
jgi:Rieske Fe-S protein